MLTKKLHIKIFFITGNCFNFYNNYMRKTLHNYNKYILQTTAVVLRKVFSYFKNQNDKITEIKMYDLLINLNYTQNNYIQ